MYYKDNKEKLYMNVLKTKFILHKGKIPGRTF